MYKQCIMCLSMNTLPNLHNHGSKLAYIDVHTTENFIITVFSQHTVLSEF